MSEQYTPTTATVIATYVAAPFEIDVPDSKLGETVRDRERAALRWLAQHDDKVRSDYEERRQSAPMAIENIDGQQAKEWIATEIRKAKAEALREYADAMAVHDYSPSLYDRGRVDQRHQTIMEMLTYADRIEEEE